MNTRTAIKVMKRIVPLGVAVYLIPWLMLIVVMCGMIDVLRNKKRNSKLFRLYFFGNGVMTWLLSPFNLTMDLLTLPYWNKGIYSLEDLPDDCQKEISQVLRAADRMDFLETLTSAMKGKKRVMQFFKWYGANNKSFGHVPEFQQTYKYIRTIGVSAFNKQQSTSEHFGPLRVTLRVLYNIGPPPEGKAFIEVGDCINQWQDNRLFIFDDTLLHRSCNESDGIRYCMFIDVLRPSPWPRLMNAILVCIRMCVARLNSIFYKNWEVLR